MSRLIVIGYCNVTTCIQERCKTEWKYLNDPEKSLQNNKNSSISCMPRLRMSRLFVGAHKQVLKCVHVGSNNSEA